MRKRNMLHHRLEVGKIVEIAGSKIKDMGMSNHRIIIFQHQEK
jgi:hypothetical protein